MAQQYWLYVKRTSRVLKKYLIWHLRIIYRHCRKRYKEKLRLPLFMPYSTIVRLIWIFSFVTFVLNLRTNSGSGMIRSALSRLSLVRKYENLTAVRYDWIQRHYPPEFSQSQQIVRDVDVCKHQQCGFDVIRNSNVTFIFSHDIGKQIKYFIEIKVFLFQNVPNSRKWLPRNLDL